MHLCDNLVDRRENLLELLDHHVNLPHVEHSLPFAVADLANHYEQDILAHLYFLHEVLVID